MLRRVVMDPLPDLADLIWAFEDEPHGYDVDWREHWPYTRVVFDLSRGHRRVSLDFAPGYEEARLRVEDAQGEVADLLLRKVRSIELDRTKGRVILQIAFAERLNTDRVFLQLDPQISFGWEPFPFD